MMTCNIAILILMILFALGANQVCAAEKQEPAKPAEKASPPMLTLALLQMTSVGEDQEANLRKADEYCRKAAQQGADIALMPEMWNIGYGAYPGKTRAEVDGWMAKSVARDSNYVKHFQALAKELNMAIVVTYLEKWPGLPRNSATLIDRRGRELFTYAKVHTCDFEKREAACTPGDDFHVAELDTAKGKIAVGIMICYDREFPESARVLMLKGAELILVPNACGIDEMRLDQLKTRAYENSVVVAMANYASPHPDCNGQSVAFDARGNRLVLAGRQEGVFPAAFDMADLRAHRRKTIWGGAFRRPHQYGAICENGEQPVFERKNAFGEEFEQDKR